MMLSFDNNKNNFFDLKLTRHTTVKMMFLLITLVDFLQKQFKYLTDNLKKCLDKRYRMQKSGAAASSLPKCNYFDQMSFLHDKTLNLPTESNVSIPVNEAMAVNEIAPAELGDAIFTELQTPVVSPATPLSSSSSSTNFEVPTAKKHREKRKRADDNTEQRNKILEQISSIDTELKNNQEDDNEDSLFCKSLVPTLRKLPPRKNKLAKIRISQLLFEMEFDETAP